MIALGLLSSVASGGSAHPSAGGWRPAPRWAAAACLLPIPIWFIASALLAPAPAWRAEYRQSDDLTGAGVVVYERALQRYWDKSNPAVPGGLPSKSLVARWDTCLTLSQAREIPIMLAADGSAVLSIDGVERLRAQSANGLRATRGDTLRIDPGTHHLHVELIPRGWASIAVLASFDGSAPRAVGSGQLADGVRTDAPKAAGNGAAADGAARCPPP